MGNESFYGPGKIVDTKSKMTVVTQFVTADGTNSGALSEIKRLYIQNGKVIANVVSNVAGVSGNLITSDFCTAQKEVFGDQDIFAKHGGLSGMGKALSEMVLIMSIWDDHAASMMWLDSTYPTDGDPSKPGVARGTCEHGVGDPATVEAQHPDASVTFSNIKFGSIGSTYSA